MVCTSLFKMTKELAREYHREFQPDPDIFMDRGSFEPMSTIHRLLTQYERQIRLRREYIAVMLGIW